MHKDVFLVCATLEDGLHGCKARGEAEFGIDELLLNHDYIGHLKEGLMAVTPRRDCSECVACADSAPPPKMSDLLSSVTCLFSITHHAKFCRPGLIAKIITWVLDAAVGKV